MKPFDLDQPVFEFISRDANYCWTVRNAVEGVQIFGGIGSGKTSGSGRMLALKYLKAGFGGLVLTVKPDEKALWQQYCHTAERSNDLIVILAVNIGSISWNTKPAIMRAVPPLPKISWTY
jgi:hypothetical protein